MDKKKSGSYYTPERLSSFISNYCLSYLSNREKISILEPSVGDGSFISSISNNLLINHFKLVDIVVVEKEEGELQKVIDISINENINLTTHNLDYLDFHFIDQNRYSLVIGNPPYVKKSSYRISERICKTNSFRKNLSEKVLTIFGHLF